MNEFGHYAVCLAWLLALYGVIGGVIGGIRSNQSWTLSVINSTIAVTLLCTVSTFALGYLFVNNDYSNQYVWQFSNIAMEDKYKIAAIWGGMDGSMLLWAFILSISAGIVASQTLTYPRNLRPWLIAVLNSSILFFLTVIVFFTNPFRNIRAPFIPPDGNGLNPLLQNPLMAIHPPMLYLGFTTFAIPFAFCLAALLSGNLSNEWIRLTRRWTLVAWGFLTTGIVLGGHWAYVELGWGGFWAWDPVENASFLPWLTGTAFLHSVMVQERKNMLKAWNAWLIILTYGLTVFGTFLTRSGIVQSVHAFASTDIGWIFLVYLGGLLLLALGLTIYRRKELASEKRIESFFSREAAFLINNLILLGICFSVIWGVMFPVLSEAITGTKQAVGIPFFNAVNVPLFLFLIFMMGVGPLIAWRKATLSHLRRTFFIPLVSSFVIAIILVWAGVQGFYPILAYSLCWFAFMALVFELHRGMRAQEGASGSALSPAASLAQLFRRHRARYGGYLVHLGVLVAAIGITASMAHKIEKEFTLAAGESFEVGRFKLTLNKIAEEQNENYQALVAPVTLSSLSNNEHLAELRPELRFYKRKQETTTEVALRMGLREDVYLVVAGLDNSGTRASFKLYINPLQVWLWFGAIMMLVGTVVVLLPKTVGAYSRVPAAGDVKESIRP